MRTMKSFLTGGFLAMIIAIFALSASDSFAVDISGRADLIDTPKETHIQEDSVPSEAERPMRVDVKSEPVVETPTDSSGHDAEMARGDVTDQKLEGPSFPYIEPMDLNR